MQNIVVNTLDTETVLTTFGGSAKEWSGFLASSILDLVPPPKKKQKRIKFLADQFCKTDAIFFSYSTVHDTIH